VEEMDSRWDGTSTERAHLEPSTTTRMMTTTTAMSRTAETRAQRYSSGARASSLIPADREGPPIDEPAEEDGP
jgi:hypothetical protein